MATGSGEALFGTFRAIGSDGHSSVTTISHGSGSSTVPRFRVSGDGINSGTPPVGGTVLLFTPPQRIEAVVLAGRSLVYRYPVSYTVWKDENGTWQAQETPAGELLFAASRLLAVSGRPQIVDSETAAELVMAGIGTVEEIPRSEASEWL